MRPEPRVVILGGGPAGLGAALGLARRGFAPTVVEARDRVGGNAGSFVLHGLPVDYGSHRLHPTTDPEILAELMDLLGDDLVERPRHGRLRLGRRWIHFPLRPVDLAFRAPPSFLLGVARDALMRSAGLGRDPRRSLGWEGDSFASVLLDRVGPTVCRDFYFPYARKIWGMAPEEISATQARKRVSSGSLLSLAGRLLPAGKTRGGRGPRGAFYYPREGFGQIPSALAEAAQEAGAEIRLGARVRRVHLGPDGPLVEVEEGGHLHPIPCDHAWSTLPLGLLARMLDPEPPADVLAAARRLPHRAMVLVYLVLGTDRYTEFDAHYVPSPGVAFTRLSEPKNYSGRSNPHGVTVLCAEIPCDTSDGVWTLDEDELGQLVREGMARCGLPEPEPLVDVEVQRLATAYPLYRVGCEEDLATVDQWISALPGLLTFGRLGLHAHDNTHHALAMARAAVSCLSDDGSFRVSRWMEHRKAFESHVVED